MCKIPFCIWITKIINYFLFIGHNIHTLETGTRKLLVNYAFETIFLYILHAILRTFSIHKWIHFTPDVCVSVYSLEKYKKFQCRIDIWSLYLKLFHLCLFIRYAVPKSAYLFQIFRSRFSVLISFLRLQ